AGRGRGRGRSGRSRVVLAVVLGGRGRVAGAARVGHGEVGVGGHDGAVGAGDLGEHPVGAGGEGRGVAGWGAVVAGGGGVVGGGGPVVVDGDEVGGRPVPLGARRGDDRRRRVEAVDPQLGGPAGGDGAGEQVEAVPAGLVAGCVRGVV